MTTKTKIAITVQINRCIKFFIHIDEKETYREHGETGSWIEYPLRWVATIITVKVDSEKGEVVVIVVALVVAVVAAMMMVVRMNPFIQEFQKTKEAALVKVKKMRMILSLPETLTMVQKNISFFRAKN